MKYFYELKIGDEFTVNSPNLKGITFEKNTATSALFFNPKDKDSLFDGRQQQEIGNMCRVHNVKEAKNTKITLEEASDKLTKCFEELDALGFKVRFATEGGRSHELLSIYPGANKKHKTIWVDIG